jgi:hypothetical protein
MKTLQLACGELIGEANGTISFPSSDGGLYYPREVYKTRPKP